MKDIGKGIATAGIWIGASLFVKFVGVVAVALIVSVFACVATHSLWMSH